MNTMGINRNGTVLSKVRVGLIVMLLSCYFFISSRGSSIVSSSPSKSFTGSEFQETGRRRTTQTVIADEGQVANAFVAEARMAHSGGGRGGTRGGESAGTGGEGGGESAASKTPSTTDNPTRPAGAGNEHPHHHGETGRCLNSRLLCMTLVLLATLTAIQY